MWLSPWVYHCRYIAHGRRQLSKFEGAVMTGGRCSRGRALPLDRGFGGAL